MAAERVWNVRPSFARRFARQRDEQHAGRVAVEAVDETRALAAEAVGHAFEHAVDVLAGAGAALHRKPERLVQDEDVQVLVEDHFLDLVAVALGNAGRGLEARTGFLRLAHDVGDADFRTRHRAGRWLARAWN